MERQSQSHSTDSTAYQKTLNLQLKNGQKNYRPSRCIKRDQQWLPITSSPDNGDRQSLNIGLLFQTDVPDQPRRLQFYNIYLVEDTHYNPTFCTGNVTVPLSITFHIIFQKKIFPYRTNKHFGAIKAYISYDFNCLCNKTNMENRFRLVYVSKVTRTFNLVTCKETLNQM
jgi:hypothetical protein